MSTIHSNGYIFNEVNPDAISTADIVVGLISHNSVVTIPLAVTKASEGLAQDYPGLMSVIVDSDGHSNDDTREVFFSTPSSVPKIFLSTPPDHNSETCRLFNIINIAHRLKAKAIIILDADLTSIKRTWISRLAEPILSNRAALTAPFYSKHSFDFPVTATLIYPLFRAMFGRRLRQPMSVDRAFSGEMNSIFLEYQDWPDDDNYWTTELTIQILAINKGLPICQSYMADPRITSKSKPLDITTGDNFIRATRAVFDVVLTHPGLWTNIHRSRPTAVTGTDLPTKDSPPRVIIAPEEIYSIIQNKISNCHDFINQIFQNQEKEFYARLRSQTLEHINVTTEEWATIIYRSNIIYAKLSEPDRTELLKSLIPVFFARLLTHLRKTSHLTTLQTESFAEEYAKTFEKLKRDIMDQWVPETGSQVR